MHLFLGWKKFFFILAVVVVLIAVSAGAYFFYYKNSLRQKSDKFNSSYSEALQLNGIYGKETETIEKFKEALILSPNDEASADINRMIAINLYYVNNGNGRIEAINVLKDIISNSSLSNQRRAAALNTLALLVSENINTTKEFDIKYIFNDEPYSKYLSESNGDIWRSDIKILEASDKLYPNAIAKTNIAFMLALNLFLGKTEPGFSNKDTANLIQKYIADSEALVYDLKFTYTSPDKASLLTKKAMALGVSSVALKNISQGDLDAAYKLAIDAADADSGNYYSQITGIYARFIYAASLMIYSGSSRKSDILQLLDKIVSGDRPQFQVFHDYLGVIYSSPKDNLLRIITIKLAALSSDFKTYLIKYGWKF